MLYVTVACILAWAIPRRAGHKWALAALVIVTVLTSFYVVNDVRTAGVERIETGPPEERTYAIVYHESTALFPFVIQMHQNLTSSQFFYRVLLLSQDGRIVWQYAHTADQPEFMHLALFEVSVTMCFVGFLIAVCVIACAEILWWGRKGYGNRMPTVGPEMTKSKDFDFLGFTERCVQH